MTYEELDNIVKYLYEHNDSICIPRNNSENTYIMNDHVYLKDGKLGFDYSLKVKEKTRRTSYDLLHKTYDYLMEHGKIGTKEFMTVFKNDNCFTSTYYVMQGILAFAGIAQIRFGAFYKVEPKK